MPDQRKLYTPEFYRELAAVRQSADEVLPIVFELLHPKSIVDIGCGVGHWLAAAAQLGVEEILGVDGEWAREAGLVIPEGKFLAHDLAHPLTLSRRFDLALSLEVSEHLPKSRAREFVQTLCKASRTILFSAAIPGQGGRHHINEQWPSYWAELFRNNGYGCYDLIRQRIWQHPKVAWYYAQNMLVFAEQGSLAGFAPTDQPPSLIHPELWSAQVNALSSPGKLLERLLKAMFRPSQRNSTM